MDWDRGPQNTHSQPISNRSEDSSMEKGECFQQTALGTLETRAQNRSVFHSQISQKVFKFIKITSNQFINLNVKYKAIQLPKTTLEKSLVHFGFHSEILETALKAQQWGTN